LKVDAIWAPTDLKRIPVTVLEHQGSGHGIGGTAGQRHEIKRIALERAGVRYIELVAPVIENDGNF
jgi:hypothetical protein